MTTVDTTTTEAPAASATVEKDDSLTAAYGTDAGLERLGVWIALTRAPKVRFLVARAGGANQKFKKEGAVRFRPFRKQIETGTMNEGESVELAIELFVDTVLKGWENVKLIKGEQLSFTRENAIKVMTLLPDVFQELSTKASELSTFQPEEISTDSGN